MNTKVLNINNRFKVPLTLTYPGLKTTRSYGKIVHDYRVNLNGIPISHVNIAIDLYNKAIHAPQYIDLLYQFLNDIEHSGYDKEVNLDQYKVIDDLQLPAPNSQLLRKITTQHSSLGKSFRIDGNYQKNYTMTELAVALTWIVLQEDINYPRPRFEGRQMPFYRYVEAIALADPNIQTNYDIIEVANRTVSHTRVPLMNSLNAQYVHL